MANKFIDMLKKNWLGGIILLLPLIFAFVNSNILQTPGCWSFEGAYGDYFNPGGPNCNNILAKIGQIIYLLAWPVAIMALYVANNEQNNK